MRIVLLIYALVLIAGCVIMIERHAPPVTWVAARDLPASRMLQSGDVVPGGAQYFLNHFKQKGQPITTEDLSIVPTIFGRENEITFSVSVARTQIAVGLNVSEAARLCKEGKPMEPVTVRMLLCAPDTDGDCLALAAIPTSRAAELASFFEKGPLPYLQATRTPACK
jgi:hypothetical protein